MSSRGEERPWLRRLAGRFDPTCWIGLVVRAIPAAATERDGVRVHTPDHYLGAAWRPLQEGPQRWPEVVVIGSPAADNALAEIFLRLPGDARLFLTDMERVDAALAATILRDGDRNLEPYQRTALDAFIGAARARDHATIAARYSDIDPQFERFRAQAVGSGRHRGTS